MKLFLPIAQKAMKMEAPLWLATQRNAPVVVFAGVVPDPNPSLRAQLANNLPPGPAFYAEPLAAAKLPLFNLAVYAALEIPDRPQVRRAATGANLRCQPESTYLAFDVSPQTERASGSASECGGSAMKRSLYGALRCAQLTVISRRRYRSEGAWAARSPCASSR